MKERWNQHSPEAETRQEEQFGIWHGAENIPFKNPEAQAAYRDRVTLMQDAIQMKRAPARIPVCPSAGHFPVEYGGINWYEAMYDYEKLARAWEKYHLDFGPDAFNGPRNIVPGKVLDTLGFKLYRWAGAA